MKIQSHLYSVKLHDFKNETLGDNDPHLNEIRIQCDAVMSQKVASLFHEIIHSMNWVMEEKEVEYLAQQFAQVMQDNDFLSGNFYKLLE
jgi:hypothetical protein